MLKKLKDIIKNSPMVSMRLDHTFLLFFHGGLLAYLLLHNLIIPLVRNLGSQRVWSSDLHFWFIPHLILHLSLIKNIHKGYLRVQLWGTVSFGIFLLTAVFYLYQISLFSVENLFSETLTIAAQTIFFTVFFSRFKRFFKFSELKIKDVIPIFSFILTIFAFQVTISKSLETYVRKSANAPKQNDVLILNVSKAQRLIIVEANDRALVLEGLNEVTNGTNSNVFLKIEKLHGNFFRQFKFIKLSPNKTEDIQFEDGIYRIRSPQKKSLGIIYLLFGDKYKSARNIMVKEQGLEVVN